MAAIQLNFTLRTTANCKTVHLLGSWDNYGGQLPLSKDASKQGGWKGTFRFTEKAIKQGQRYWYYYIIDGYHASHDPAKAFTTESTTGRNLNILDIPSAKSTSTARKGNGCRQSLEIPKGRSLSPSQIKAPTPVKPNQTRNIVTGNFDSSSVEALSSRLHNTSLDDSSEFDSDLDSDVPSLTSRSSRSSNSSSPSSVSSSGSCCTCERYGITRGGERVKLDCGGERCGYSEEDSCSSEDDDEYVVRTARRDGIYVRA